MKTAIITGANGFLGTALTKHLVDKGIKVIAIVKDEDEYIDASMRHPNVTIVYAELDQFSKLAELIEQKADTFYHFAWAATAGPGRADYDLQLKNAAATCAAVEAASQMGCQRFVMAGSILEWEAGIYLEQEAFAAGMNHIYGIAKQAASQMGQVLARHLNITFVKGVISNIYGVGENSQRIIISSIKTLLKGETPAYTSGTQPYDFLYISDAAQAFYLLGKKGQADGYYYIGNPTPRTLKDYLCELRDCVNPALPLGFGNLDFTGVQLRYDEYDTRRLRDELGFTPQVGFKQGICNTIQWIQSKEA